MSAPVAIVGIGCRFPGGIVDPASFWRVVRDGVDAITEIPVERFDAAALFQSAGPAPGRIATRWGGFLDGIDQFDAAFFGISPRDAERLDPQQRLLLETSWEALEDAGQPVDQLLGSRVGVFVGMWLSDFEARLFANPAVDFAMTVGSGRYAASGRLSYALGLQGPSLTVDSACSSSLVAVHLACQSLRSGECPLALAGAANVILQPHITVAYSQAGMMAADGRCKFGDARADGYVRSEGVAVVALKLLERAVADGDRVHAVIRGSAVNNDGRSGDYMARPAQAGHEQMLRLAYADAGIAPGRVAYVEAHGTGTRAGDPVELKALGAVVADDRSSGRICAVGSVKTNIGHTEAAAGLAGLIKAALVLKHREIPPSLHLQEPNPEIPWADLPLAIVRERMPLPCDAAPAIAGVNSFGITGTNAHVVLEEAPALAPSPHPAGIEPAATVVPLSARAPAALRALAGRWLERSAAEDPPALADLAYTAAVRRSHHEHRLAVVGRSAAELNDALSAFLAGEERPGVSQGRADPEAGRRLVWVFSGQGAQQPGMGQGLLDQEPVFRETLEACDRLLRPLAGWSLLDELAAPAERSRLERTEVAQPAMFALQVALAALWRSWGIVPDAVLGHSVGEVAAAHVAGALSLDDAIRVIHQRGRVMQDITLPARMAAVGLSRADAEIFLGSCPDGISLAAVNGPTSCVLSGDAAAVEAAAQELAERGVFVRLLPMPYAFHSPHMAPARAALVRALADLRPRPVTVPMFSSVTGRLAAPDGLDALYWGRNVREPVLFADAVAAATAAGFDDFLELGPHPLLRTALEQCAGGEGLILGSLDRALEDRTALLQSLAALYTRGYPVAWPALHPSGGKVVPLPGYPWQRSRFWLAPVRPGPQRSHEEAELRLPGRLLSSPAIEGFVFESRLDGDAIGFLGEHRIDGQAVAPAALFAELAASAARAALGWEAVDLRNLAILHPLVLPQGSARVVQSILRPPAGPRSFWELHSRDANGGGWILHATGDVAPDDADEPATGGDRLEYLRRRCATLAPVELESGHADALLAVDRVWRGQGEALAQLRAVADNGAGAEASRRAALLDACFRLAAAEGAAGRDPSHRYVVGSVRRLRLATAPAQELFCHIRLGEDPDGAPGFLADARFFDRSGACIGSAEGIGFAPVARQARSAGSQTSSDDWLFEVAWRPRPLPSRDETQGNGFGVDPARLAGRYLVLADSSDLGRTLADALGTCGQAQVLTPPDDPQALEALVATWLAESTDPSTLVCLGSLANGAEPTAAEVETRVRTDCAALLAVARALIGAERAAKLWIVTRGAQPAGGVTDPAAAALWGLGRVIALEAPASWGGLIDLAPGGDGRSAMAEVLAQLAAGDGEDQAAFRAGERFVPRLTPIAAADRALPEIRGDASYLITGGLGSIGLELARWLAERGAGHIVLTGRTALPDPEAPAQPPDSPAGRRSAALREIEALGASVMPAAVDVSDAEAMAALLARFGRELPPLKGVFHAAAVMELAAITRLQPQQLAAMLRPKVRGGWLLHELTRELDLDHFVLFSSAAGLWGSRGMAHYAAANQFLDGLANYRKAQGLPALAIDWGGWAGGDLARETIRFLEQSDLRLMPPGAALDALGDAMAAGVAQRTVAWADWASVRAGYELGSGRPFLHEIDAAKQAATASSADHGPAGPLLELDDLDEDEARALLTSLVRDHVAAVLKLDSAQLMEPRQGFFKLGMDSLMTVELRGRLERSLGLKLPTTIALEYPTVESLAHYLEDALRRAPVAPAPSVREAALPSHDGIDETGLDGLSEGELATMLDVAVADLLAEEATSR